MSTPLMITLIVFGPPMAVGLLYYFAEWLAEKSVRRRVRRGELAETYRQLEY